MATPFGKSLSHTTRSAPTKSIRSPGKPRIVHGEAAVKPTQVITRLWQLQVSKVFVRPLEAKDCLLLVSDYISIFFPLLCEQRG